MKDKFMYFIICVLFISCNSKKNKIVPPEYLLDIFYQTSDNIIQGYTLPLMVNISDSIMIIYRPCDTHDYDYNESRFLFATDTIKIVSFIQENEDILIMTNKELEYFRLHYSNDNYLNIYEVIPTGIDNETGSFLVGKFTSHDYLNIGNNYQINNESLQDIPFE